MKYTLKFLRGLPVRRWDTPSEYDALLVVPTREIHDSGWRLMAIVGCINGKGPVEIAAHCDVVDFQNVNSPRTIIKTDMDPNNNCVRVFSNTARFLVGTSLSSTDVTILEGRGQNENR